MIINDLCDFLDDFDVSWDITTSGDTRTLRVLCPRRTYVYQFDLAGDNLLNISWE